LPKQIQTSISDADGFKCKSIHEDEREYIISDLKKCNGKVSGEGVTAEVLKVPPSTLQSKMKQLDIRKEFFRSSIKRRQ
jgi:transcriptional regulator with GAF, ATPase, and Fis domain